MQDSLVGQCTVNAQPIQYTIPHIFIKQKKKLSQRINVGVRKATRRLK